MRSSAPRRSDAKTTGLGFPAFAIWGSELSPFALKLRALLEASAIPYAWLPRDGSRLTNYRALRMIGRAKRRRTVIRHPRPSELDEYPLVPFLIEEGEKEDEPEDEEDGGFRAAMTEARKRTGSGAPPRKRATTRRRSPGGTTLKPRNQP